MSKDEKQLYYNGDPNLKAAGVQHQYTLDEIREFKKCSEDPVHFIRNYVMINTLDHGMVLFDLYPTQEKIIKTVQKDRFTIILLPRQFGKALALDYKIPTPSGFRMMKDIHVGDVVYGDDGIPCTVTYESPVMKKRFYKMTFDTNEVVESCEDHQWTVRDENWIQKTYTSKQLAKIDNISNLFIENCKPIEGVNLPLLVDPYEFGVGLRTSKQKIPEQYLFASKQQRLSLLQGIVGNDNLNSVTLTFNCVDVDFVNSIKSLIFSLGFCVYETISENTITISTTLNDNLPRNALARRIVSVEPIDIKEGKCIQVNNQSHMYLCGENFLPTHNSTVMMAYCLWHAIFKERQTLAIMANKLNTSKEILSRVKDAYINLPNFIKPGIREYNKTSIVFDNGSRIFAAATSASAIRGFSVDVVFLDEAAFIPAGIADEFLASIIPTITSGKESKLVLISTPCGMNHFYKIWKDAEQGNNNFTRIRGYWQEIHDQKWYEETCKLLNNDSVKIMQEIECGFVGSSYTLVSAKKLNTIPISVPIEERGNIRYFKKPLDNHTYVITVDVARGRGRDYTAFSVFDVTTLPYQIVCTYKDNTVTPIVELPILLNQIGLMYNHALMLIESNDLGESVASLLFNEYEYDNLVWTNQGEIAGHGILGIKTTAKVKSVGCHNLKIMIENDQIELNDSRIIDELQVFTKQTRGQYASSDPNGVNDDLVTTLWLAGWLFEQPYFKDMTDTNITKTIGSKYISQIDELLPIGFKTTGLEEFDPPNYHKLNNDQLELLS